MAWRAARSLLVLHRQLKAGSRAAPPATGADEWGLLGDAQHDPTSDHAPHDFPGWGNDIVTAADFPNRPDLGLDAHAVLDDIRRARDPRAKYGISNGQIFSNHPVTEHGHSYPAWTWRPYLTSSGAKPADGHYTHGHLSVVGDSRADGEQPWPTIGGDEVEQGERLSPPYKGSNLAVGNALNIAVETREGLWVSDAATGYGAPAPGSVIGKLYAGLAAIQATLTAVAAQVDIDPAELAQIQSAARDGAAQAVAGQAAALEHALTEALTASLPDVGAERIRAEIRTVFAAAFPA